MQTEKDIIASIALTRIHGIGLITANILLSNCESASQLFEIGNGIVSSIPDIQPHVADLLANNKEAFAFAKQEYQNACRKNYKVLTYHSEEYPTRLRECPDAPPVLYYKGNASLNTEHCLSIIGTRRITSYGQALCDNIIRNLSALCPDALIISGLAYGVDVTAHTVAIANNLQTVGVMAHGLDRIYPSEHRNIATQMCSNGGILTEFPLGTTPERQNFVCRNRIVAGISQATLVIETPAKGGSLITANMAMSYGRDVLACPGRIGDNASEGCNKLIKHNGAALVTSAEDIVDVLGWKTNNQTSTVASSQQDFFEALTVEQRKVAKMIKCHDGSMQINMLSAKTDIPIYQLQTMLFDLEMKNVVKSLFGGVYELCVK